jgi:hypothetical protein
MFFQNDIFFLFMKDSKFILLPSKKSYRFRVTRNAATMLPALLPAIIVGMQSAYIRTWTTPI